MATSTGDTRNGGQENAGDSEVRTSGRLKSFTDGVVAIAMTLLILPLMGSITDAAAKDLGAGEWFVTNASQLISFVLSFAMIANFWVQHHRMFDRVRRITNPLLWLTLLWMFFIVWLPVATSLIGQLRNDPVQNSLYIGTLAATSLVMLITRLYLRAHPELHETTPEVLRRGLTVDIAWVVLFAAALLVAILVPVINYFALFLLALTSPLQKLLLRWSRHRDNAES